MKGFLIAAVLAISAAAAMSKPAAETPTGKWLAEDIGGAGVIDDAQSWIEIKPDGAVAGSGACNRLSGKAAVTGAAIAFGPMISTKMACAPALMAQEDRFFSALSKAAAWRVDSDAHQLILSDQAGAALVTFSAM